MGIKAFHLVFVALSILLCGFLAVWGIVCWRSSGDPWQLVFGAGAIAAGIALVIYGRHVFRKLKGMSYL